MVLEQCGPENETLHKLKIWSQLVGHGFHRTWVSHVHSSSLCSTALFVLSLPNSALFGGKTVSYFHWCCFNAQTCTPLTKGWGVESAHLSLHHQAWWLQQEGCMAPVTLAAHGSGLQEHPRTGASQGITPALSVQGWASLCQGTGAAAFPVWVMPDTSLLLLIAGVLPWICASTAAPAD